MIEKYAYFDNNSSHSDLINIRNNEDNNVMEKKIEKVSRFHNPKPISDRKILNYLRLYSKSQIRNRFGVGKNRIDRIERQMKYKIRRQRKTTRDQDHFICKAAFDGVGSSKKILNKFKNKYPNSSFSRSSVIRRLRENKFKYRKPRHMQKITNPQKFLRYNFASNRLLYHSDDLPIIFLK